MPALARAMTVLLPLLLVACAQVGSRPDAGLTGTVAAPPGTTLPASVSLRVTLLDVGVDLGAEPIAEVTMDNPRLPVNFAIGYDPRAIDDTHRYLLQAQLTGDGRLLLLTTDEYAVITQGHPRHADIVLAAPGEGVVTAPQ